MTTPNVSTNDDFRYELGRVLGSDTFAGSPKQRDLIKWLVEQTLAAEQPSFSQYEIAVNALGYAKDFDPDSDSRVRTAMRRLREKLGTYYETEGRLNRSRIVIEDGQYIPQLIEQPSLPAAAAARPGIPVTSDRLSVLVLPVLPIGFKDETQLCDLLTLDIMRAIGASGQARVVPWTTAHWLAARTGDKREHYLTTSADVILEPLVRETSPNHFSATVQWIDGPTGLTDRFFEVKGGSQDTLAIVDDLAAQLADGLRITYDERSHAQLAIRHSSDPGALTFYLRARRDAMVFTPQTVRRAFELLGQALQRDEYFAAAHALQAELHLAVAISGAAPARMHGPLARASGEHALKIAPQLGDALTARGAVELTYDWDFPRAETSLLQARADPLAEAAGHWTPIVQLAYGRMVEGAAQFEKWARLDPGSGAKAAVACEFWYFASQFDEAIRWGLLALELDPLNLRGALLLAASLMEAGRKDESLHLASQIHQNAPDFCEANLMHAALLAYAGKLADARRVVDTWNLRKSPMYESPALWTIVHAWLGEKEQAFGKFQEVIEDRQNVCIFARHAPFFEPLRRYPEFDRMLTQAGLPPV